MNVKNKLHLIFGYTGSLIGFSLFVFFLILLKKEYYIPSVIPLLLFIFFGTSYKGTIVDTNTDALIQYNSFFGFMLKKRVSLNRYPSIIIIKNNIFWFSSRRKNSIWRNDQGFLVCMASASHCKKLTVKRCKTKKEAEIYARYISIRINKTVEVYSPAIRKKRKSGNSNIKS